MSGNEFSHDNISMPGSEIVSIIQQRKGFRFTLDSLLLADFCSIKPRSLVFEPGAGTGIISLLLAKKFPQARFIADESEPATFELLCRNIEDNGLKSRIFPAAWDIKELTRSMFGNDCDVIIANPPYTKTGAGIKSPDPGRAAARHTDSLDCWLALEKFLKNKGKFCLIFPAARLAEILQLLHNKKLEPKRLRFVHPKEGKPASLVMIESVKSAKSGLILLPPLVIHLPDNSYTPELHALLALP